MQASETSKASSGINAENEHVDVIIIGAGIAGIGAARELHEQCPNKSFVVLDGMEDFGGTWLWHKYPGTRSDSDLYTFGYRFKPWLGDPIAKRQQILNYLGEVIEEYDLNNSFHYGHRVLSANWCSKTQMWTLQVETGSVVKSFTSRFLWMCSGYYRHSQGYLPDWQDFDKFEGTVVHPQTWPDDLDYKDKRVVVIGSGATAATLVPAMAPDCKSLTMLQRSPTYFAPAANKNRLANMLREIGVDDQLVHEIVRKKYVFDQGRFLAKSMTNPEEAKEDLIGPLRKYLTDEQIKEHFTPKYRPWQQRIAAVPDADLLKTIRDGQAEIVTDHIERFDETGIQLKSGRHLEADIVVTATGFNICVMGDVEIKIDGEAVDFSDVITYRGFMYTGIPNMFAIFISYLRAASFTLKVDLVVDAVCKLLNHMDDNDAATVEVALRPQDSDMELGPLVDPELFNPGLLLRHLDSLPKCGDKPEWQLSQDYWWEKDVLPELDYSAPEFVYTKGETSAARQPSKVEKIA